MYLNLADFKPYADGTQLDSPIIQTAINELASAGGGTLNIPAGRYKIGAIVLKSNITLHLEAGATLVLSEQYEDFAEGKSSVKAELSACGAIFAMNAENIAITGQGKVYGNADHYHAAEKGQFGYRATDEFRPRVVIFENCRNVKLVDFSIEHAPMWTVHLISCSGVSIDRMTIQNDLSMSNTDAIDIDSCQNVRISNCNISAADDCICLKTTDKPAEIQRPIENVTVTNCTMTSKSCAVKLGTESFADMRNITFSNCTITNTNRAIGLSSRDGGEYHNLIFKNIIIETAQTDACHWGKADPISISTRYRHPDIKPGKVRNVIFSDIIASSEGAINFHGIEDALIENITLSNVQLTLKPSAADDRGCFDVRPPCNPVNPTGMGIDNVMAYNEETGKPFGVENYPGGMPAVFARNVKGLNISGLNVDKEGEAEYWNTENVVTENCF